MSADQTSDQNNSAMPPFSADDSSADTVNGYFGIEESQTDSMSNFGEAEQFYEGVGRREIVANLPFLHLKHKNLVLIEGREGLGKTTVLKEICKQTPVNQGRVVELSGAELQGDQKAILDMLRAKFSIDESVEDGKQLAIAQGARYSGHLVLLVDDAQKLAPAAVTVLLEFLQHAARAKTQLVLAAEPRANVLTSDPSLQEYLSNYGKRHELRCLASRDTGDYCQVKLATMERDDVQLDRTQIQHIYQTSEGVPARINEALVQVLQFHDQNPGKAHVKEKTELVPKWHVVALSMVAVGVIGLIIFGNPDPNADADQDRLFSETVKGKQSQSMTESRPADIDPALQSAQPARDTVEFASIGRTGQVEQRAQDEPIPTFGGTSQSVTTQTSEAPVIKPSEADAQAAAERYRAERQAAIERKLAVIQDAEATEEAAQASTSGSASSETLGQQATDQAPVTAKPATLRAPAVADIETTRPPAPASEEKLEAASIAQQTPDKADWVKNMNPAHFTLQLLGGANEAAIRDFVEENGSYRKMGYFETEHQGKPWYVVVYGDFASRSQAVAAVGDLPAKLRKSEPWPRSGADVRSKAQ